MSEQFVIGLIDMKGKNIKMNWVIFSITEMSLLIF